MSEPTFKSADHALRASFDLVARPIIKNASITAVMTGGSPPPGLLSPQEKHAQAAMVVSYCMRLPDNYRAYIYARYAGRELRPLAFHDLTLYILVGTEWSEVMFRAYRTIVEQYFSTRKTEIRGVRRQLKASWNDALAVRRTAFKRLDVIHDQAIGTVTRHMEAQGLIQPQQEMINA